MADSSLNQKPDPDRCRPPESTLATEGQGSGQTHLRGRLVVLYVGLLVKLQRKPKALHGLDCHGSGADCVQSHLHEIIGEGGS